MVCLYLVVDVSSNEVSFIIELCPVKSKKRDTNINLHRLKQMLLVQYFFIEVSLNP